MEYKIGNTLHAIMDMLVQISAAQTVLKEHYCFDKSKGDIDSATLLFEQMEHKEIELREKIRQAIYAQYGSLPPDIDELINPK